MKFDDLLLSAAAVHLPAPLKESAGSDPLATMVATAEECGTQARILLAKSKGVVGNVYRTVFKKDAPASLREAVEELSATDDPIVEYGRERTSSGMLTALALTMAHGVEMDQDKVCGSFPTGADGKEVRLGPFLDKAKVCAQRMSAMLEERAAARALAKRGRSSKGGSASGGGR